MIDFNMKSHNARRFGVLTEFGFNKGVDEINNLSISRHDIVPVQPQTMSVWSMHQLILSQNISSRNDDVDMCRQYVLVALLNLYKKRFNQPENSLITVLHHSDSFLIPVRPVITATQCYTHC